MESDAAAPDEQKSTEQSSENGCENSKIENTESCVETVAKETDDNETKQTEQNNRSDENFLRKASSVKNNG